MKRQAAHLSLSGISRRGTDLYDEQDQKELEAIANEILSEGADALDTEPFTLIELPPEDGGRKK